VVGEGGEGDLYGEAVGGGEEGAGAGGVAGGHGDLGDAEVAGGGEGGAGGGARAQDEDRGAGGQGGGGHAVGGEGGDEARDVGVVAVAAAGREHHRVRRAGLGGQRLGVVEQREHSPLERHGQRQAGPARAAARQQARQAFLVALDGPVGPAGEAQRPVGGPVQDRREGMRDR
jgi:hypothetical protein